MVNEASSDHAERKRLLLCEIEEAISQYRKYRKRMTMLHWSLLVLVTMAGFFTTAAGSINDDNRWFSSPNALVTWGLIAALGAIIVQNLNPAKMAETFEQKKDTMRAIRTAVKFRNLDLVLAAELMENARHEPSQVLKNLSDIIVGCGDISGGLRPPQ